MNPQPHNLIEVDGDFKCVDCEKSWLRPPTVETTCLGAPLYQWDPWPDGLLTTKQIKEKGLLPGRLRGLIPYSKSKDGYLKLYRLEEASPKPPLSPARAAAVAKMQAARIAKLTCKDCGRVFDHKSEINCIGLCFRCDLKLVRGEVEQWAAEMIAANALIVDVETSGLGDAEILSIAIINTAGEVLLDTFVKPRNMIDERESDEDGRTAYGVNGISNAMVADAPGWEVVAEQVRALLKGRQVIAYNASFDEGQIKSNCKRLRIPQIEVGEWHCLMLQFSAHFGEWSDYWGDWKWQSLDTAFFAVGSKFDKWGDAHTSAGDCARALAVLRGLAADPVGV